MLSSSWPCGSLPASGGGTICSIPIHMGLRDDLEREPAPRPNRASSVGQKGEPLIVGQQGLVKRPSASAFSPRANHLFASLGVLPYNGLGAAEESWSAVARESRDKVNRTIQGAAWFREMLGSCQTGFRTAIIHRGNKARSGRLDVAVRGGVNGHLQLQSFQLETFSLPFSLPLREECPAGLPQEKQKKTNKKNKKKKKKTPPKKKQTQPRPPKPLSASSWFIYLGGQARLPARRLRLVNGDAAATGLSWANASAFVTMAASSRRRV